MTRITVICTGKGTHGRIDFDSFDVDGDDIQHVNVRRGKSPIKGTGTAHEDDREIPIGVGPRMVVPVTPGQAENGTWRWRCPCGQDRPLGNARLRKALLGLVANNVSTLDVSHLR